MRLPRDVSGSQLVKALARVGYDVTRQTSGHVRLTTRQGGQHHVTVPNHTALRIGTLAGIVGEVSRHLGISRDELLRRLFP